MDVHGRQHYIHSVVVQDDDEDDSPDIAEVVVVRPLADPLALTEEEIEDKNHDEGLLLTDRDFEGISCSVELASAASNFQSNVSQNLNSSTDESPPEHLQSNANSESPHVSFDEYICDESIADTEHLDRFAAISTVNSDSVKEFEVSVSTSASLSCDLHPEWSKSNTFTVHAENISCNPTPVTVHSSVLGPINGILMSSTMIPNVITSGRTLTSRAVSSSFAITSDVNHEQMEHIPILSFDSFDTNCQNNTLSTLTLSGVHTHNFTPSIVATSTLTSGDLSMVGTNLLPQSIAVANNNGIANNFGMTLDSASSQSFDIVDHNAIPLLSISEVQNNTSTMDALSLLDLLESDIGVTSSASIQTQLASISSSVSLPIPSYIVTNCTTTAPSPECAITKSSQNSTCSKKKPPSKYITKGEKIEMLGSIKVCRPNRSFNRNSSSKVHRKKLVIPAKPNQISIDKTPVPSDKAKSFSSNSKIIASIDEEIQSVKNRLIKAEKDILDIECSSSLVIGGDVDEGCCKMVSGSSQICDKSSGKNKEFYQSLLSCSAEDIFQSKKNQNKENHNVLPSSFSKLLQKITLLDQNKHKCLDNVTYVGDNAIKTSSGKSSEAGAACTESVVCVSSASTLYSLSPVTTCAESSQVTSAFTANDEFIITDATPNMQLEGNMVCYGNNYTANSVLLGVPPSICAQETVINESVIGEGSKEACINSSIKLPLLKVKLEDVTDSPVVSPNSLLLPPTNLTSDISLPLFSNDGGSVTLLSMYPSGQSIENLSCLPCVILPSNFENDDSAINSLKAKLQKCDTVVVRKSDIPVVQRDNDDTVLAVRSGKTQPISVKDLKKLTLSNTVQNSSSSTTSNTVNLIKTKLERCNTVIEKKSSHSGDPKKSGSECNPELADTKSEVKNRHSNSSKINKQTKSLDDCGDSKSLRSRSFPTEAKECLWTPNILTTTSRNLKRNRQELKENVRVLPSMAAKQKSKKVVLPVFENDLKTLSTITESNSVRDISSLFPGIDFSNIPPSVRRKAFYWQPRIVLCRLNSNGNLNASLSHPASVLVPESADTQLSGFKSCFRVPTRALQKRDKNKLVNPSDAKRWDRGSDSSSSSTASSIKPLKRKQSFRKTQSRLTTNSELRSSFKFAEDSILCRILSTSSPEILTADRCYKKEVPSLHSIISNNASLGINLKKSTFANLFQFAEKQNSSKYASMSASIDIDASSTVDSACKQSRESVVQKNISELSNSESNNIENLVPIISRKVQRSGNTESSSVMDTDISIPGRDSLIRESNSLCLPSSDDSSSNLRNDHKNYGNTNSSEINSFITESNACIEKVNKNLSSTPSNSPVHSNRPSCLVQEKNCTEGLVSNTVIVAKRPNSLFTFEQNSAVASSEVLSSSINECESFSNCLPNPDRKNLPDKSNCCSSLFDSLLASSTSCRNNLHISVEDKSLHESTTFDDTCRKRILENDQILPSFKRRHTDNGDTSMNPKLDADCASCTILKPFSGVSVKIRNETVSYQREEDETENDIEIREEKKFTMHSREHEVFSGDDSEDESISANIQRLAASIRCEGDVDQEQISATGRIDVQARKHANFVCSLVTHDKVTRSARISTPSNSFIDVPTTESDETLDTGDRSEKLEQDSMVCFASSKHSVASEVPLGNESNSAMNEESDDAMKSQSGTVSVAISAIKKELVNSQVKEHSSENLMSDPDCQENYSEDNFPCAEISEPATSVLPSEQALVIKKERQSSDNFGEHLNYPVCSNAYDRVENLVPDDLGDLFPVCATISSVESQELRPDEGFYHRLNRIKNELSLESTNYNKEPVLYKQLSLDPLADDANPLSADFITAERSNFSQDSSDINIPSQQTEANRLFDDLNVDESKLLHRNRNQTSGPNSDDLAEVKPLDSASFTSFMTSSFCDTSSCKSGQFVTTDRTTSPHLSETNAAVDNLRRKNSQASHLSVMQDYAFNIRGISKKTTRGLATYSKRGRGVNRTFTARRGQLNESISSNLRSVRSTPAPGTVSKLNSSYRTGQHKLSFGVLDNTSVLPIANALSTSAILGTPVSSLQSSNPNSMRDHYLTKSPASDFCALNTGVTSDSSTRSQLSSNSNSSTIVDSCLNTASAMSKSTTEVHVVDSIHTLKQQMVNAKISAIVQKWTPVKLDDSEMGDSVPTATVVVSLSDPNSIQVYDASQNYLHHNMHTKCESETLNKRNDLSIAPVDPDRGALSDDSLSELRGASVFNSAQDGIFRERIEENTDLTSNAIDYDADFELPEDFNPFDLEFTALEGSTKIKNYEIAETSEISSVQLKSTVDLVSTQRNVTDEISITPEDVNESSSDSDAIDDPTYHFFGKLCCPKCNYKTKTLASYQSHAVYHVKRKKRIRKPTNHFMATFQSDICKSKRGRRRKFRIPPRTDSSGNLAQRRISGESSSDNILGLSPTENYSDVCFASNDDLSSEANSQLSKYGKTLTCPHCAFRTSSNFELSLHRDRSHPDIRKFYCPHCSFSSYNQRTYEVHKAAHKMHRKSAADRLRGNHSGYIISSSNQAHQGYLPAGSAGALSKSPLTKQKCPKCPYMTLSFHSFKSHLKTHKGIELYECISCSFISTCDKTFQSHCLAHSS